SLTLFLMRKAAERDDADGAPFQILEAVDLGGPIWGDRQRQQRQAGGRGEPLDVGTAVDRLDDVVERRRGVVDCAADQRLRRRGAAAHVDEIYVEALVAKIATRPGDLKGRDAQDRAAKGELDRAALGKAAGGTTRHQRRGASKQPGTLQYRAPFHGFI